jgi:hypothetical protein
MMGTRTQARLLVAGLLSAVVTAIAIVAVRPRSVSSPVSPPRVQISPPTVPPKSDISYPRAFLRQVVTTRALAIESPASIAIQLDTMPTGNFNRARELAAYRQTRWSLFFKGTLVKLGRTASTEPLAVFYNPILDVAVIEGCGASNPGSSSTCQSLCAIPGETLSSDPIKSAVPSWLSATDPLQELSRIAGARMLAFEKAHPPNATDTVRWETSYCSRQLQSAAEARIARANANLADLDVGSLSDSISEYLKHAQAFGAHNAAANDIVLPFLMRLPYLSLSGAVETGDQGRIVFLTPKHTGWRQAALILQSDAKGKLTILGVRLLKISTSRSNRV